MNNLNSVLLEGKILKELESNEKFILYELGVNRCFKNENKEIINEIIKVIVQIPVKIDWNSKKFPITGRTIRFIGRLGNYDNKSIAIADNIQLSPEFKE